MRASWRLISVERAVAYISVVLAVATASFPAWIEAILGVDPDHGSGLVEWLLVAGLAVVGISSGALARHHGRRLPISDTLA
jgi:hypothetical protein